MTAVLEETPTLITIHDVELVSVGQWDASTGPAEFTKDDLAAMIAALDDPAIHAPRLRIGHTPPNISPSASAGGFEEQPAFGRFTNLRLNETGTTILADAVGVPAWLAEILPAAYPSRSVEVYWNVTTAQGKTHAAVITSVALLGVSMPAVETLEDLRLAFGAEMPDGVQLQFSHGGYTLASKGGPMPNQRVSASVTYTDVRRSFYEDVATDESGRYWWWVCDFVMSPPTVIADDDEGGLWSVPYTLKGDTVTWGDPVEVRVQYVEKESGKVAAALGDAVLPGGERPGRFTAAASRPTDRVRAATTDEEEHMPVAPTAVLERLGLPEDATEEQMLAKLDETPSEPDPDDEPDNPTDPAEPESPTDAVAIDPETLAQLQADAKAGREARAEQVRARQTTKIDEAIKAGKFPPSRRDHYLALMEKDETGTSQFIDKLAAGAIPVDESGRAPSPTNASAELEWFPQFKTPAAAGKEA